MKALTGCWPYPDRIYVHLMSTSSYLLCSTALDVCWSSCSLKFHLHANETIICMRMTLQQLTIILLCPLDVQSCHISSSVYMYLHHPLQLDLKPLFWCYNWTWNLHHQVAVRLETSIPRLQLDLKPPSLFTVGLETSASLTVTVGLETSTPRLQLDLKLLYIG